MKQLNPKDNPRFYEVAHEFGLIVEGEEHLTREERRDKALMKKYKQEEKQKEKEYYK